MIRARRTDVIAVAIVVAVAIATWVPRFSGPIDLRWDAGAYYVLGKSLAQGHGYRLLNEPGEIQSTLHPPMLPVIFGLSQWVLQSSDPMIAGHRLRVFYFILFISYAVAAYLMLRMFLSPGYAVLGVLVCLFQLHTIFMSDLGFPELPFALATLLFVLCHRRDDEPLARRLCALLAIVAFLLRTVGLALIVAWAIDAVCRRRVKARAPLLLLAVTPVVAWGAYVAYTEAGSEYQHPAYAYQRAEYNYINVSYARNLKYKDPFSPELGLSTMQERGWRFLANWTWMPSTMAEAVTTRLRIWESLRTELTRRTGMVLLPSWTITLTIFFLAGMMVVGQGVLLTRGQYFIPLYTFLSFVMVCATPWPGQFNRYFMPLTPFLSLSLFVALQKGVARFGHRVAAGMVIRTLVPAVVVLTLFIPQAMTLVPLYRKWHSNVAVGENGAAYRLFFYQGLYGATDRGLNWLKGRAQTGDIVAATDPQWVYLRTDLKSVLPPFEIDAERAQAFLDSVPVTYLIVDASVYRKYTAPVVATYPERWSRVYFDASSDDGGREPEAFEIYERIGARGRQ